MGKSQDLMNQVQLALETNDLRQVEILLKQWQKADPKSLWFQFYVAQWFNRQGKQAKAAQRYRKLLQLDLAPKLMLSTRQALRELEELEQQKQAEAIAAKKSEFGGDEYGLFVLEPVEPSAKKAAAQHFAKVMETDPYSAQLQIPLKSWRLFRTGALGELRFSAHALQQGNIPCFCLPFDALTNIQVLQVRRIQQLEPDLVVEYTCGEDETSTLTLPWSEITQYVTGMLPLFEESLEKNSRGKTYYKTKVLDYAYFLDLHVGDRQTILRLNDQHYQFREGISFFSESQQQQQIEQHSVRQTWNNLNSQVLSHIPKIKAYQDFKSFAAHAADFPELLRKIDSQTYLFRQEEHQETHWDPAWQLYSAIAFAKAAQDKVELISATN